MKSTRIAIILLILVLSGCGSSEEIGETMVNDTTSALTDLPAPTIEASATAILPNTPVPTTEPIHTETPDLGLQPYSTDFSEANDDWEVILSEGTTNAFRESEHYVLEATGITTTVVSSPNSILAATDLSIEVDLSFAQTEGESGEGGIICGYAGPKAYYGLGVNRLGYAFISQAHNRTKMSSLVWVKLASPDEQQNYHLRAVCSSTSLGLIVDGKKVLQYPVTDFIPGRIGLYSEGAWGYNSNATETIDLPNIAVFDNFSTAAMEAQDEWVTAPIDPFEYLISGEVLYSEEFSAPMGDWTRYADQDGAAELEDGKLSLTDKTDAGFTYSKLNSFNRFTSGVMMETDFTVLPGAPEGVFAGFFCDVDGSWNEFYEFHAYASGASYFKFSNGAWKGIGSWKQPADTYTFIETDRIYHLTGICGAGYLAILLDGVPAYFVPIPEQTFHSVGLTAGIGLGFEGEATFEFDNFKISRVEPINN